MSESGKPVSELGFENSLTDRFQRFSYVNNKPDFKEFNLGSPVSPLRTRYSGSASGITSSSSSSSSSGSISGKTVNTHINTVSRRSGGGNGGNNHSGELSVSSENSPTATASVRSVPVSTPNHKSSHMRSYSENGPLLYSGRGPGGASSNSSGGGGGSGGGGSSANSLTGNALPTGNICPSGKIPRTGIACKSSSRSDVLGLGTGNYGIGSIIRGGVVGKSGGSGGGESMGIKKSMFTFDPEEVKRAGNEEYKKGHFTEALRLYERAISISPENAACHSNRAAALTGLGRLGEAVKECEEAIRLDPGYYRAHQRLGSLLLRLGQVEIARKHLCCPGQKPDSSELKKLDSVERHFCKCSNARKIGDWKSALMESDAAIIGGADSSPQLFACRTEALLKLHQLEEADTSLSKIPKLDALPILFSQTLIFGMLSECYVFFVRAQVDMALGRFENAVAAAEKAGQIDPRNIEVTMLLKHVRLVVRARSHGNDLFKSGKFSEACLAYGEGLKFDPTNSILYCNRAACWSKLGQWEKSVEDCNLALKFQPNYAKALLRRAASNGKLERWVESVRDYELLRKQLDGDNEVAEALFHAQVALKKSRGEDVYNMKFGGEVEEISDLDQFRAVISSPSVSVVHFKSGSNKQCERISPFVDSLCVRYPSVNFLKVDVEKSPGVAKLENVRVLPTFKIYKEGRRVKEMICPDNRFLESSVRHYSL